MKKQVRQYIDEINQQWQVEVCNKVRNAIYHAIPEIEEQIKYKQAFYTLNGKQVCVFFPAKSWVNVTIFNAENIEAPEDFFEKTIKSERKTIKIHEGQTFDYDALKNCLIQANQSN